MTGLSPQVGRLLKPADVAERFAVSRSWVYEAAGDGRLPSIRLGGPDGPLRFIPEEVDTWIDKARSGWQPSDSRSQALRRVARQTYAGS